MKTIELQYIIPSITPSIFQMTSSRGAEHIYSGVHDVIACVLDPFTVF